ncbi:MAG: hypothetical protein KM296_00560 [Brockia lithotrophica]|nr:hypothetical protein [Brockia lithotrophica]
MSEREYGVYSLIVKYEGEGRLPKAKDLKVDDEFTLKMKKFPEDFDYDEEIQLELELPEEVEIELTVYNVYRLEIEESTIEVVEWITHIPYFYGKEGVDYSTEVYYDQDTGDVEVTAIVGIHPKLVYDADFEHEL